MGIQIGGVSLPGPGDLLDGLRAVTGWGAEATEALAGLPHRIGALLTDVEQLIPAINEVAARADRLVGSIETVSERASALVASIETVSERAGRLVGGIETVSERATVLVGEIGEIGDSAGELLTLYQPLATDAAPLARRFVEELSETEIIAAIRLVDQLPMLAEHMETDIMPILGTLDRVGPDINELLTVVKDLSEALDGIPGLGLLRRRNARQTDA